jgi:hypothetical protein
MDNNIIIFSEENKAFINNKANDIYSIGKLLNISNNTFK